MQRPCHCDTYVGPLQKWTAGAPNCLLCYRFHTHPGFHKMWGGTDPKVLALPVPAAAPSVGVTVVMRPLDESRWPAKIRALARLRRPADAGAGDTAARVLARFGANAIKWLYTRVVGGDCGCGDRQKKLNAMYPYMKK